MSYIESLKKNLLFMEVEILIVTLGWSYIVRVTGSKTKELIGFNL